MPSSRTGVAIDTTQLLVGLFGGLAVFLHGMEGMSESLRLMAGNRLRKLLVRLTGNRFMGAATGVGITAVIQSSSVTAQIIALEVTDYALVQWPSGSLLPCWPSRSARGPAARRWWGWARLLRDEHQGRRDGGPPQLTALHRPDERHVQPTARHRRRCRFHRPDSIVVRHHQPRTGSTASTAS